MPTVITVILHMLFDHQSPGHSNRDFAERIMSVKTSRSSDMIDTAL